jgi:16S rRNA A1518/A1519 N6-dimethyltransferase RsmA/KsgA/DIM1 with predicted DNA glycosylase/AP lyase activity
LFSSRRKTVKHNLREFTRELAAQHAGDAARLTDEALAHCNIDAGARAEDLALEDFAALATWLTNL